MSLGLRVQEFRLGGLEVEEFEDLRVCSVQGMGLGLEEDALQGGIGTVALRGLGVVDSSGTFRPRAPESRKVCVCVCAT